MQARYDEIRKEAADLMAQVKAADASKKVEIYQQIINKFQEIPEKERTHADWRELAEYQNNVGFYCKDSQQKLALYEKAVASLQHIPENVRTNVDWLLLARCHNNVGFQCKDSQQKLALFEKAVASLQHIPEKERTVPDWSDLAIFHLNVGIEYKKIVNYTQAPACLLESLASSSRVVEKSENDYAVISECYNALVSISLASSLAQQLYVFATEAFSATKSANFQTFFPQLHAAILVAPSTQPNVLLRGLVQFMQLIETSVDHAAFPNKEATKYFADKNAREQWRKMLRVAERAYAPQSLLSAVGGSPSLSVALVTLVSEQGALIKMLTDQLAELRKELQESRQLTLSVYQSGATMFARQPATRTEIDTNTRTTYSP